MIILIVTFLAFIMEFIFNRFLFDSLFLPLIILTTIILVEPYFKKNKNKYYVYAFVVGFLYDLVYTGNYFMNSGWFLLIAVLVCFVNSNIPNNLIASILELLVLIIIYRLCSYSLFLINDMVSFSFVVILRSIYSSLILNVCYGVILYFILYFISKKFNIKRIN